MRRLVVSMNVSLDGCYADRNGGLGWHFGCWSGELGDALGLRLAQCDTILLGGNTFRSMAGYWSMRWADPCIPREELALAEMMQTHRKLVVTRFPVRHRWKNVAALRGDVLQTVQSLKSRPGKDIMVYGSGRLMHLLQSECLIDHYQLWIHPVVLKDGLRLFQGAHTLHMVGRQTFSTGIVLAEYDRV